MARRGIFGRLPRAAPDLTASIVALVREAQAQTDSNFIDAWKNGGKVDGKGVPDARLLAHLRDRRDMLSKDDPAWDEWNNRYGQYQFAIEESKVNLKYDQTKMSDMEVAAFYKKWAKDPRVQQDSEFYRHLLDQSAKFVASAKAKANAGRAGSKVEAHNNWVQNIMDHGGVQAGFNATNGLLKIAIEMGAAPGNAQSLDDVYANSVAWGNVLQVIETGKSDDPKVQGYIDSTTRDIKAAGEPGFTWSQSNINGLLTKADRSVKVLQKGSRTPSERKDWTEYGAKQNYERTRIKQARPTERVEIATTKFATDLDNCNGDPYCARNVTKDYRDKLVAEEPNMLAQKGGLTAGTVDIGQSSMVINTINQLDGALSGTVQTLDVEAVNRAAEIGGSHTAEGSPQYNLFDGIAGASKANGGLITLGNHMVDDMTKLDNGGWIDSHPATDANGHVLLDGDNNPIYEHVVHAVNEAHPPGTIPVVGTTMWTDNTRTNGATHGSLTVTPVIWVKPQPAQFSVVGPDGDTIDASTAPTTVGGNPAAPPWTELQGVPGPDGTPRTVYRIANPTGQPPYLITDSPPVPAGTKFNAAGQPIIQATTVTDPVSGKVAMSIPVDDYMKPDGSVAAATHKLPSENYPIGTFTSIGAATTAQAIRDAFAHPDAKTGKPEDLANHYIDIYQTGINQNTSMTPAERAGALRDIGQLNSTVTLYKGGNVGKMLDDNYNSMNQRDPTKMAYQQQLEANGFSDAKYGTAEMDRRIGLLASLDAADQRIADRSVDVINAKGKASITAANIAYQSALGGKSQVDQARKDVLNPSISVSNIKIPGVPSLMQPGGQLIAPGGYGGPGVGLYGPSYTKPTAYPAPASKYTPGSSPYSPAAPGTTPNVPSAPPPMVPDKGQTPTPKPPVAPVPPSVPGAPGGGSALQPGEPVPGKGTVGMRPPSSGSTSTGRVPTR